eukprot:5526207-Prorocentrum_lima.AAC.1
MVETGSLEQHYKQGSIPKRQDCPVCQQTSGPVVRHHLRSDRAEQFGTLHVDLTGQFEALGEQRGTYVCRGT